MNVLMFVLAMLMVMSLMTYSKFNEYRVQSIVRNQFDYYIEYKEHTHFNQQAAAKYEKKTVRSNKPKEQNKEKTARNTNPSQLLISVLLDRSQQSLNAEKYERARTLLKNLIFNIYGKQEFLLDALKERPDLLDEMINRLPEAIKNLPNQQKITKPQDLANLNFDNTLLNETFYKLLKGSQYLYENQGVVLEEGFPSLTNFITIEKKEKIRVFLASKEVLGVLFDPNAVEEIIRVRESFHREVNNGSSKKDLTDRFQKMFEGSIASPSTLDSLDFSVTGANPKNR